MQTSYGIITTTLTKHEQADALTQTLLEQRLVACVHSFSITSHYIWNGDTVASDEIVLQMKTTTALFDRVRAAIELLHPYEVPEIIMTPIIEGNQVYLEWIDSMVMKALPCQ